MDSESSLKENNEKLDDEPNGLTPDEEKHNSDSSSKEGDKPRKTLTTTSTKLTKKSKSDPSGKKTEHKSDKEQAHQLRKRICLKMAKMIQDKTNISKDEAQKLTIELESRVRSYDPNMGSDYRSKIMVILKLVKVILENFS